MAADRGSAWHLLLSSLGLLVHLDATFSYLLKNCTSDRSLAGEVLDCSGRGLVTVPDDIPADACSVNLMCNLLGQINKKDFGKMSQLKILCLTDNHIAHVDDGSFVHMVSLTNLYMGQNNLTNLTANLLQGLSNLRLLDLRKNKIQFIHGSTFKFSSVLQTVLLDDNHLRQVADIIPVLQLPLLHRISVGENWFSSFQSEDFPANMSSSLKVLDMSYSNIDKFSITRRAFPHLQTIDLSLATLKWDIPDETSLRNIIRLHLSHTKLSFKEIQKVLQSTDSLVHLRLNSMDRWIKRGLMVTACRIPTLQVLELYYNHGPNLSAQLANCSHLRELDLSDTHMMLMPKGSIQSMKLLQNLKLKANFLKKVPDDIRKLYLSSNHITNLNWCTFESLTGLKILDLSLNQLWELGDVFQTGPQKLEFLYLNDNPLAILEKRSFKGLKCLKYLDVVTKTISRVTQRAFDGLNNLRALRVSFPCYFDSDFRHLQRLENLTLYFSVDGSFQSPPTNHHRAFFHLNSLKMFTFICSGFHHGMPFDVPMEQLQAMRHLEDFTAENAYISAPDPSTFQANPRLKRLTFGKTDLSDLDPELFRPIPDLQVLDLSNSQIKSLDFLKLVELPALTHLTLSNNEITVINETVFQSLPALVYLKLDNNPFTCDCSNAGFIQWVKNNNQTQVVNGYQLTCSFPVAEQGNRLLNFDIQSCWMDLSFLCFLCSTGLVTLTLLTSFIFHFLRWSTFYLLLAFLYDSRKKKKGTAHLYDAFVSYNVHDEAWVYHEMLPVLEGEQGWRLCLHHRDFQPGRPIMENITDAIYGSRKTICVISRRYLQSEWCSREIQVASFRLFDEQKDVLVLLFLEDIPARQLSPFHRMRKLVKRRTYLSWPQAGRHHGVFWQNLRRVIDQTHKSASADQLLQRPPAD
uniref:Toll-like receptor 23-3 n=1 Tax=Sillago sinica TaxID=907714 RepID=A0A5J6SC05_9TELE|nr:toll-like receptor 23-3 [Sillago sinica]